MVIETYGKLQRGEPLSKLSAAEQDAADAQNERTDEMLEKQNSDDTTTGESTRKKEQ